MNSQQPETSPPLAIRDVCAFLQELAPLELAESWDNVGLLWGDTQALVARVMTCLTLSSDVADEAARKRAELIVVHHPILFRPVQRLTHETPTGGMLLTLARHGIAVYSAHTAYDNADEGINRQLADRLGLEAVTPLRLSEFPRGDGEGVPDGHPGLGRMGRLPHPRSLSEFISDVKRQLAVDELQFVGPPEMLVERVAIACGAGSEFLEDAFRQNCQVLLTGEARFHTCVEARERGFGLILLGHFSSEQPAMHRLAEQIRRRFPALEVWASTVERDPLGSA
jgi:dinuclear metal center YbgI/SA1388 family protein